MGSKAMVTRRIFVKGLAAVSALGALSLAGCSDSGSSGSGSSGSGSSGSGGASTTSVKVGTMPTEDLLPLWAAEADGLFSSYGIDVEIVTFDSAQNLSAAITAGEVDFAMTDPMRSVKLVESGTDVSMEWITLGTTAQQGRFGILAPPDAEYATLADLAAAVTSGAIERAGSQGVGVGSNTVPEYVFDKLCEQAGLAQGAIPSVEVASLPERYTLLSEGQLAGAALPESMLSLGEASGMKVIGDDTLGDNISQSVMIVRTAFKDANAAALEGLRGVWDEAADKVNASPESYRSLLVEKANLNDAVAATYPISTYPQASSASGSSAYPPDDLIEPVIEWMKDKGYSEKEVSYDDSCGKIIVS